MAELTLTSTTPRLIPLPSSTAWNPCFAMFCSDPIGAQFGRSEPLPAAPCRRLASESRRLVALYELCESSESYNAALPKVGGVTGEPGVPSKVEGVSVL